MKKTLFVVGVILIILAIIVYIFLFFPASSHDGKVVYPLAQVKKNESAKWSLKVIEVPNKSLLIVSDDDLLYKNRKSFKVTLIEEVYWSTPTYLVEVFRDDEKVEQYPLFHLEQIDFGTIEQIDFGTTEQNLIR